MPTKPSLTDHPLLLTPKEAATMAGVSPTRLRGLARAGRVQHVRLGGRNEIRFTHDQLQQAVELLVQNGVRHLKSSTPDLDEIAADPRFASLRSLRADRTT